jgi:phosphoribosyl 1,2-cyclic phosphodiesterase
MKITFLGTSAANAFPEPFCSCANCQGARGEGGRSLRKRSSALINDDLLIDLGPDIMASCQMHNVDLTGVRWCLQTHPHADHLDLSHLLSRSPGFGVVGAPRLHFYASSATLQRADQSFRRDLSGHELLDHQLQEELNLEIHEIGPFDVTNVGPYEVVAFPANHAPGFGALLYAISRNGKSIFYGTDTASLFEETWDAFHDHRHSFDLVVLDHTYGPEEPESDHLNAQKLVEHVRRMRKEGLLKANGRAFATHIAHEGNPPHSKLVEYASQNGYEVGFDGLVLDL